MFNRLTKSVNSLAKGIQPEELLHRDPGPVAKWEINNALSSILENEALARGDLRKVGVGCALDVP